MGHKGDGSCVLLSRNRLASLAVRLAGIWGNQQVVVLLIHVLYCYA